jgi:uncharacterized delta-60 repeat protein
MKTLRRVGLAVALPMLVGGGLFAACGGDLASEALEACDDEACDAGMSPNAPDATVAIWASDAPTDRSRPATDAGGGDAAGGSDAAAPAVLLPCGDGGLPGMLDPTFGAGGVVDINVSPDGGAGAAAVVLQPDGKTVLAGGLGINSSSGFGLFRLTTAGDLDTGFGDGGIAGTFFAIAGGWAEAVALAPDSRVLVGGRVYLTSTADDFAIARFSPGGALDGTFGDGGVAFAGFGSPFRGYVDSIDVLPDGHVLVAGVRGSTLLGDPVDYAVAKFNPNGSLDTSFGTGGKVMVDVRSTRESGAAMAVQPDGKILVAGSSSLPAPMVGANLSVVRLGVNGGLDPSFGAAGKFLLASATTGGGSAAGTVAVDGAGRIVLGGLIDGPSSLDFAVVRLTPTGALDSTFGSGGVASTDFGGNDDGIREIFIQSDGKYLVAGTSRYPITGIWTYAFARFQPDGTLDPGFGTAGRVLGVGPLGFRGEGAVFSGGRAMVGGWWPGPAGHDRLGAVRYCL